MAPRKFPDTRLRARRRIGGGDWIAQPPRVHEHDFAGKAQGSYRILKGYLWAIYVLSASRMEWSCSFRRVVCLSVRLYIPVFWPSFSVQIKQLHTYLLKPMAFFATYASR